MRHCETCTCPQKPRKAIPKVSHRQRTRAVNGIVEYPDGRERCASKKSWQKRREEVWERDGRACADCGHSLHLSEAEIHHIRKRSLGRDDRADNLKTLCTNCHRNYDSKPQWKNTGKPIKGIGWSAQWQERT